LLTDPESGALIGPFFDASLSGTLAVHTTLYLFRAHKGENPRFGLASAESLVYVRVSGALVDTGLRLGLVVPSSRSEGGGPKVGDK